VRVESKNRFSISSARIQADTGEQIQFEGFEYRGGFNFPFSKISKSLQRNFHPHRLLFQILFAFCATWMVVALTIYGSRFRGLKDIFIQEQRYLFWLMLSSSITIFSFWHFSFWPGVTSNDSLEVWRAAQIPGMYLGDHPPLNVIFYMFLSQFWNNVAIVPFIQNGLTSLLVSYIFFTLMRKGLPVSVILPCFALIVFSLPVGLYSIILWKDVPFALLVVLLGFKIAILYLEKRCGRLQLTGKKIFTLLVLTLALVGFRHNGVLYLFIVPFLLILFGIVKIRPKLLVGTALVFVLLGAGLVFSPQGSKTTDFLKSQTETYLNQAMDRLSYNYLKESGEKYFGIFDVNQTYMQWDLVHLCMYGRYTNDFLKSLRWNDVYAYLPLPQNKTQIKMKEIAWWLYWKSYESPWVFLSWNPFYMLIFFPLLPFLYRKFPMASIFSLSIFIPVAILVFLNIFNWRYYYFAFLACYFLIPLAITDHYAMTKLKGATDVNVPLLSGKTS